jgi:two-component system sensor histidine kinase KdpD
MATQQTGSEIIHEQLTSLPAKKRGSLKIYFGYAAGVGKTIAMLNDALEVKKDGVDVVAGYIETHDQIEPTVLIEGLESLPPSMKSYKGMTIKEFDLDGAIRRNPELILIDELAHTNAEGSRHKQRYQDVEELLRAGINVYTTINVQHIESLNDVVASITGIDVIERIPDSVFDSADQIELIDIEPNELIERLHKGKVYLEENDKEMLSNFFVKEKLIALREIALRRTADQVNRISLQNQQQTQSGGSYSNEHILVCLSSAPSNAKVIRMAARMADAFHGIFTALFVETPETLEVENNNQSLLKEHLRLAEQLGAQIATVYGEDIPSQIAEYAKVSRVSKIVIGRSNHKNRWLPKNTFVDRLSNLAPNIDIYIIPDSQPSTHFRLPIDTKNAKLSLADTLKTAGVMMICTIIGLWFDSLGFSEANIITIYILGVLINAIITKGRIYSIISSVVSVIVFDFIFTEPYLHFHAFDVGYPITFLIMLVSAIITSTLTKRVKEQAREAAQKAYRTEVLLETSHKLQQASDETAILSETAQQLVKLLNRTIAFYSVQGVTLSEPMIFLKTGAEVDSQVYINENERSVAEWVYKNNKRAGATTNTLSEAKCLYLAVRGKDRVFAVAGIGMEQETPLETFEKSLVIAMLGECGLALEKEWLYETNKQITLQAQQEQLRANLLRGISHDLRTPLTSISGNADILIGNSIILSESQKFGLYTDIYDDAMWLINLVENLLSITRIDNGTLNLNIQPELLDEVIAEALLHVNRKSVEHKIESVYDDEFLMAKVDSRLITQVIINIIDNAIKYTPVDSQIIISVKKDGEFIRVEIADDGPGIPDAAKAKLFDMFYTANSISADGRRGLGLGLTLCKAIINAHGGTIYVKDNIVQGTVFGFTLPAEEVVVHE